MENDSPNADLLNKSYNLYNAKVYIIEPDIAVN